MTIIQNEIWVYINGEWKILDTIKDASMSFNFILADITELVTRNSNYSKSITLPDTLNNRSIFEFISELTVDSLFNQNLKTKCKVLSNGVLIFAGNLQLKQVNKNYKTNECNYEVVIFNDNDTFIRNIGEKFMSDLDISYLDHNWTTANIIASWYENSNYGYFYPLIDYGNNYWDFNILTTPGYTQSSGVKSSDMYPAVYVRILFDAIIRESGFTYKSNFIESEYFNKLIIPYNNQETMLASDEIFDNTIRVEYDSTPGYYSQTLTTGFQYRPPFSYELIDDNNNYIGNPTYGYFQNESFAVGFGHEHIVNVIVAGSVSKTGDLGCDFWIDTLPSDPFYYSQKDSYGYTGRVYIKFRRDHWGTNGNVPITNPDGTVGQFYEDYSAYQGTKIIEWQFYTTNTYGIWEPKVVYSWPGLEYEFLWTQVGDPLNAEDILSLSFSCDIKSDILNGQIVNGVSASAWTPAFNGEKFDVLYSVSYNDFLIDGAVDAGSTGDFPIESSIYPNMFPLTGLNYSLSNEMSFYNQITSKLIPGAALNMNTWLSKRFKQKDFIKSLINMFNLVIDVDKTDERLLLIEPWNDYYGSGEVIDWTDKIDLESIKLDFVSDYQAKKNDFTYKNDGDYLNKTYQEVTGEVYGEEVYEFDNDFINDEKKIETSFSPSPLISLNNYTNSEGTFPITRLSQNVTGGKFGANLRILFKNFIQLQGSPGKWTLYETPFEGGDGMDLVELPYAGHLDNPYNPTEDLNYGQVYTSSFKWVPTKNTLFNKYWSEYMDLINNSNTKILTAKFLLNPVDINNFNFNNYILITLNGVTSKYIVNRINNYNPSVESLTEVELIKI